MIPGTVLHNCVDIIENFHLTLNNYCFFRITVEYVKLTLRPLPDAMFFFLNLLKTQLPLTDWRSLRPPPSPRAHQNKHLVKCYFLNRLTLFLQLIHELAHRATLWFKVTEEHFTFHLQYRRIFVFTFCLLITYALISLSDDANRIKISEYWKDITVSFISENLSPIHRMFWERFSSKNSKFYRECTARSINVFATQQFRSFWWLIFPSILLAKSWKLHKLLNLISSVNFCI